MKKQKPIQPIGQELSDEERYGNVPPCSLRPQNYADIGRNSPALMGTMLRAEQKMNKILNRGANTLDILNQIESL